MNDRDAKIRLVEEVVDLLTDHASSHERIARRVIILRHVLERRRGNHAKTKDLAKQLGVTEGAVSLGSSAVESALLDLLS